MKNERITQAAELMECIYTALLQARACTDISEVDFIIEKLERAMELMSFGHSPRAPLKKETEV